jgi:hypothetical protein
VVSELLIAAAASLEPWPILLIGTGPAGDALRERAQQLCLGTRIRQRVVAFLVAAVERHGYREHYTRATAPAWPPAASDSRPC